MGEAELSIRKQNFLVRGENLLAMEEKFSVHRQNLLVMGQS